jgi:hypothetical protein
VSTKKEKQIGNSPFSLALRISWFQKMVFGFNRVSCKPLLIFFWPEACQPDKYFSEERNLFIPDQKSDFTKSVAAIF